MSAEESASRTTSAASEADSESTDSEQGNDSENQDADEDTDAELSDATDEVASNSSDATAMTTESDAVETDAVETNAAETDAGEAETPTADNEEPSQDDEDSDEASVAEANEENDEAPEASAAAEANGDPIALNVQAGDLFFGEAGSNNLVEAPVWTVSSGQEINLTFQNNGGVQHNWAVLNLGVTEVPIPFFEDENAELLFFNPGLQDAGTTFEATLNAPAELGEYLVICTAPGHYPVMQGRLVVE